MAMITDTSLSLETEAEGIAFAREVLRIEAEALSGYASGWGQTSPMWRTWSSDVPAA